MTPSSRIFESAGNAPASCGRNTLARHFGNDLFQNMGVTSHIDASVDTPSRGRPREFDRDVVLDNAVRVFCERGIARGLVAVERVRLALVHYAEASHGQRGRLGCMVISGASELATFDDELARWVAGSLRRNETLLAGILADGVTDGSIAPHVDPASTARLLLCVTQGMRVVGKTGGTRKDMLALVDIAMKTLA